MPMHDWTLVSPGTYHGFHTAWNPRGDLERDRSVISIRFSRQTASDGSFVSRSATACCLRGTDGRRIGFTAYAALSRQQPIRQSAARTHLHRLPDPGGLWNIIG